MRLNSLRSRIIFPLFISILGLFVIFQGLGDYNSRQEAQASLINHIDVLSSGVALNLQAAVLFEDQDTALEVLNAFSADPQVIFAQLSLSHQPRFASYGIINNQDFELPEPVLNAFNSSSNALFERKLYSQVPVMMGQDKIGSLYVVVDAQSLYDWHKAAQQAAFYLIMCLLTGLFLFSRIKSQVITPLESLNQAVRKLSQQNSSWEPVRVHSEDELGDLVHGFNRMGAELTKRELEISKTLERLEQEKAYATEVIESAQYALIVADSFGDIKLCNFKALELFNQRRSQMEGSKITGFLQLRNDELEQALQQTRLLRGSRTTLSNRFGEVKQLSISSSELPHIGWSLFTIEDITEQEKHIQRQRLMARVFENSQDGLLVINHKQQITMTNPAFVKLLGYSQEELIGKQLSEIEPWDKFRHLLETVTESFKSYKNWQGELWEEHKDGHSIPLLIKANPLASNDQDTDDEIVLIINDISNVKEVERLEYLAHHDSLTGLFNRSKLYTKLDSIITSGELGSFALIYMDLDGFKSINDNFGHLAGDAVLKSVANRLQDLVRNNDLVARLAGDEFVIIQRETDENGSQRLAQRILKKVSQPIVYENEQLLVGVSIGVHMTQRDKAQDSEDILRAADKAMYSAKAQGKGKVVSLFQANR